MRRTRCHWEAFALRSGNVVYCNNIIVAYILLIVVYKACLLQVIYEQAYKELKFVKQFSVFQIKRATAT